MYQTTDCTPATAHPPAGPGTGTAAKATTPPPSPQTLHGFTVASIAHLDATAARHRADEAMYRALAAAHQADPYLLAADRMLMQSSADQRADNAAAEARITQQRADELRAENPAAACAAADAPMAVVVITVHRDRIHQTARLVMGGTRSATRAWKRVKGPSFGFWKSIDPEWAVHEDHLGTELIEYMDALPLPDRIAAMLPAPPAPGSNAAAKAAEEVRRG